MKKMGISIIIPAYNVERQIKWALTAVDATIAKLTKNYEIIVVDDGSSNNTKGILRQCTRSNGRIKLISYPANIGKGYALKCGVRLASKDAIIFANGDRDISISHINNYINKLAHCDIIVGSKRHKQSYYKAPVMRKFLGAGFNVLTKVMVGLNYTDTQAGLKAFRKDAIKQIMDIGLVKSYAFDVEVLVLAKLLRLKVEEAPVQVSHSARFHLRSILHMFVDLLGIVYRLRVKKWYQRNLA